MRPYLVISIYMGCDRLQSKGATATCHEVATLAERCCVSNKRSLQGIAKIARRAFLCGVRKNNRASELLDDSSKTHIAEFVFTSWAWLILSGAKYGM